MTKERNQQKSPMNISTSFKLENSLWPKGSEWRRWDLHIHTPASALGFCFSGIQWSEYVEELESKSEINNIAVIGVTDYMSIDGYEMLLKEKMENGKLSKVNLLIPNIEFRIMPPTDDGKAINLHLLVDSSASDHIDKIKRSLKNLKFTYKGEQYGCCRSELIEFGRAQDPALIDDNSAYRYGISQFKPDRVVIMKWLLNEAWLKENSLLGIANGNDGISGLPLDGFGAIRDELLSSCHFVFSGNPSDRIHYLGQKPSIPKDEIIRQYKTLKPCVNGCDAHKLDDLFKPSEDRYCWIKADPTFNGLRQILWEPAERIHIGTEPPYISDQSQVIRCVSFNNSDSWFSQDSINLNSGLVVVIGEKGSGKTAFADMISFAAGMSYDPASQSSFITKAGLNLDGAQVKLEWGSGETTEGVLRDEPYPTSRPRVRYLSQDFVERLCSADIGGIELQKAIEEVIFSRLSEVQREGYSSFSELRKARESSSDSRRESLRGELATLHKEVERLQLRLAERPKKVSAKDEAEAQLAELQKQIPEAIKTVDKIVLKDLEDKEKQQKKIQDEIASVTRRKRVIETVLSEYRDLKKQVVESLNQIGKKLIATENSELVELLVPQWNEAAETEIERVSIELNTYIVKLSTGSDVTDDKYEQNLVVIESELERLRHIIAKDEVIRRRVLDLQKQISEKFSTVEKLDKEIENLDNSVIRDLDEKKNRQLDLYMNYFNFLKCDESTLGELYSPLQEAIEQFDSEMNFSVTVGYQIEHKQWLERSIGFFDGRRARAEAKRLQIERIVETQLVPAWKSGDIYSIKDSFKKFIIELEPENFPSSYGTSKLTLVELYDWMYSMDHISLTYKIKYGGIELEHLSPGTRGIALLVLYLLMDEDDTRPLIIDQPEGNLDNSSVFHQLVPYIRKAKRRRQIILITHNPNLVVTTDAEQVIVSQAYRTNGKQYPTLSYTSGSLEHSYQSGTLGIKEAVCLLLEGGIEAFLVREKRYALPG